MTDSGATWSTNKIATLQTKGSQTWQNVASSAGGNVLIALATYNTHNNPVTGQSSPMGLELTVASLMGLEWVRILKGSRNRWQGRWRTFAPDGGGRCTEIGAIDAGGLFFGGYNYDVFRLFGGIRFHIWRI